MVSPPESKGKREEGRMGGRAFSSPSCPPPSPPFPFYPFVSYLFCHFGRHWKREGRGGEEKKQGRPLLLPLLPPFLAPPARDGCIVFVFLGGQFSFPSPIFIPVFPPSSSSSSSRASYGRNLIGTPAPPTSRRTQSGPPKIELLPRTQCIAQGRRGRDIRQPKKDTVYSTVQYTVKGGRRTGGKQG